MIANIGIDIVETDRIKRTVKKFGRRFLSKVFTAREIDYSMKKRFPAEHLAARFAAKEALLKALGDLSIADLKKIEVKNLKNGKPIISLHKAVEKIKNKRKIKNILISISHSKKYAVAMVLLTTN